MIASRRHVAASACLFLGLADLAFLNTVVLPRAWRRASVAGVADVSLPAPARFTGAVAEVPAASPVAPPAAPVPPAAPAAPALAPARSAATILFPPATYRLDRSARQAVEQLAARLRQDPGSTLLVEGHTDRIGEDAFNKRLSRRRASSVFRYLTEQGVDASRVMIRGFGASRPVATGDDPGSLQRNRRVEMIVTGGAS